MIIIGASAVFGKAFKTTKNGSRTFDKNLFHHNTIAIIIPNNVPINSPKIVSSSEIPICWKISLDSRYFFNKTIIFDGLLNKNGLIIL